MLRLTVDHPDGRTPTIRAEGRLVGDWAALLEQECARAAGPGGRAVVDLSAVTDVDLAGIAALRRIARGAVTLLGATPILLGLLAQEEP